MDDLKRALQFGKKHATFECHVYIHDIVNVPYVSGTFRAKWKFHNAVSSTTAAHSLAQAMKLAAASGSANGLDRITPSSSDASSLQSRASTSSEPKALEVLHHPLTALNSALHQHHTSSDLHRVRSNSSDDPVPGSIKSSFEAASSPDGHLYRQDTLKSPRRPNALHQSSSRTAATLTPEDHPPHPRHITRAHAPEPKGTTRPVALRDFTVYYHKSIMSPVSIPLSKSNALEDCFLKISIKHAAHTDRMHHVEENKLGHVLVNLSEFVKTAESGKKRERKRTASSSGSSGSVHTSTSLPSGGTAMENVEIKRFLLADGKTNALLRLTIVMVHIGGETDYHLASDEKKLNGVMSNPSLNSSKINSASTKSPSSSGSSIDEKQAVHSRMRERGTLHSMPLLGGSAHEETAEQIIDSIFSVAPQPTNRDSFQKSLRKPPSKISLSSRPQAHSSSSHSPERGQPLLPPLDINARPASVRSTTSNTARPTHLTSKDPNVRQSITNLSGYVWEPAPSRTKARLQPSTSSTSLHEENQTLSSPTRTRSVRWDDKDDEFSIASPTNYAPPSMTNQENEPAEDVEEYFDQTPRD